MRFESCVISKAVYICQVLREGAISAVKPKSLRGACNISVRAYQKFESENAISAVATKNSREREQYQR